MIPCMTDDLPGMADAPLTSRERVQATLQHLLSVWEQVQRAQAFARWRQPVAAGCVTLGAEEVDQCLSASAPGAFSA